MGKKNNPKPEVYEYQAEMQKLLEILVHSLYTEREIFLREIVCLSREKISAFSIPGISNSEFIDRSA